MSRRPNRAVDPDLGDPPAGEAVFGTIADKAKMTFRSRVDGIVIQRDVVPGNFYDDSDVLMVIAPLDELWVWSSTSTSSTRARWRVGQTMGSVSLPRAARSRQGRVRVASEVSRETRAVQVRASIPNPGGQAQVRHAREGAARDPPVKGQTVIPRLAMVVINGEEYVFVGRRPRRRPRERPTVRAEEVAVAQENSDFVVIASGLAAGEMVATSGSLILAQLYEDLQMVETGMPSR